MAKQNISSSTKKVDQKSVGVSIKPSNKSEFPVAYGDNLWDIVENGTNLSKVVEGNGSFTQHDINEALSEVSVPKGSDGDVGKILEKGNDGFIWSDKPVDGKDGDSAYEVYVKTTSDIPVKTEQDWVDSLKGKSALEIYNESKGTNFNEAQFVEELKLNYPMSYVEYNSTAAAKPVGTPFGSIGTLVADETTSGKLYLMPNNNNDATILFVTVKTDPATYMWYNLGNLDIPTNVVLKTSIDDTCSNGSSEEPASARIVTGIKTTLGSVKVDEEKYVGWDDWSPDGKNSGYYQKDGTWVETTAGYCSTRIPVDGYDRVRFLGYCTPNSTTVSYSFLDGSVNFINNYPKSYDQKPELALQEYSINVPEGAKWLVCLYQNGTSGILQPTNFYCYRQKGKTIGERIDDKVSYDEMSDYWSWRKNLISQDRSTYQEGGIWTSSGWNDEGYTGIYGMMSNKLYLADGVTYTASMVNVFHSVTTDKYSITISRFDSSDNFIDNVSYYGIKTNGNEESPNGNAGMATFKYKAAENEAYARIRLRVNANTDFWRTAQIEVGSEKTEYAPYLSEKIFDIPTVKDTENLQTEIDEVNSKFIHVYNQLKEVDEHYDRGYVIVDYKRGQSSTVGYLRKVTQSGVDCRLYEVQQGKQYYFSCDFTNNTGINMANYALIYITGDWVSGSFQGEIFTQSSSDASTYREPIGTEYLGKAISVSYDGKTSAKNYKINLPEGCTTIVMNAYDNSFKLYVEETKELDLADMDDRLIALEESKSKKKEMNILAIGNSGSQDSLSYVPFLMQNIAPEIDINIGILMSSSASTSNHITNFENYRDSSTASGYTCYNQNGTIPDPYPSNPSTWTPKVYNNGKSYTYQYFYSGADSWGQEDALISIQQGLEKKRWDVVLFNVTGGYSANDVAKLNKLVDYVVSAMKSPSKIGIINPAGSVSANGKFWRATDPDTIYGRPESDESLMVKWLKSLDSAKLVVDGSANLDTLVEFVLPVNAAICNALSVEDFKKLGDLSKHLNNKNYVDPENPSAGCYGYLRAPDGVHLQEGLPCQIASYAVICKILDLCGLSYKSVLGDDNICNSDWISGKNIPGMHPDENTGAYTNPAIPAYTPAGWDGTDLDKERVIFAQKCAVMANKHPYSITDMNNYWKTE